MLYKPKFCCNCGEKVERRDPKPWSSTRFCELCESENKFRDWLPRAVVAGGVLAGVFGFGSYLQKSEKPLNITRNVEAANLSEKPLAAPRSLRGNVSSDANSVPDGEAGNTPLGQKTPPVLEVQQNGSEDAVYFCGAKTKKGKPCTRLVKGGGRCWQHEGKAAILPREKLLAGK
jgi:hypothetical protein